MAKSFILTQNQIIPSGFLAELARELRDGRLAAFPTDTVYGLGTAADSEPGLEAIYRLKGRPPEKPLPLLVDAPAAAWRYAEADERGMTLAERFWPGPLTMILPPTGAGKRLLREHPAIGLRVPKHRALQAILRELGGPLASTSANLTGRGATGRAEDLGRLEAAVDFMILEAEPLPGIESTVVDLTRDHPRILREGAIATEEVLAALDLPAPPRPEGAAPAKPPSDRAEKPPAPPT